MECPQDSKEFHPLYAQKKAQSMWSEDQSIVHKKIIFLVITQLFSPMECEWVDPHLGFFALRGKKEDGVMRVVDLPNDAMILNTRHEGE